MVSKMGEYAEMMLDGTMCAGCGEYMGSDLECPGYCSKECAQETGGHWHEEPPEKKFPCTVCKKKFATNHAQISHERDKHDYTKMKAVCPSCGKVTGGLAQHMEAKGCVPTGEQS